MKCNVASDLMTLISPASPLAYLIHCGKSSFSSGGGVKRIYPE